MSGLLHQPRALLALLGALALVVACSTSPTGRRTLKLFPDEQMSEMGAAAYNETKQSSTISTNAAARRYVDCVSSALTRLVPGSWEVTLFADDSANAFALPGGKIGVFTGLLEVATNADQLAAVIGHEIAHVQAEHANERVSTGYVAQAGLQIADAVTGAYGVANQRQIMSLLGLGAQVGVLLPFSRAQESEADVLGQVLMAKAGFDPRESVSLWQNMARQAQGQPPEFLSTHPSHGTRIEELRRQFKQTVPLYEQARQSGQRPNCGSPR